MTINKLRETTSFKHLSCGNNRGQIATLLILIIVVMLIFVMATVNIGKLSLTATNLSNAADFSSLYLASQLATKAHGLSQTLFGSCDNYLRCCVRGGILATILAIVGAIVAIVLSVFTFGAAGMAYLALMGAGALGGAIGGAIGGGIVQGTFSGALTGALTGAAIGFAIGGAVAMGYAGVAYIAALNAPTAAAGLGTSALASTLIAGGSTIANLGIGAGIGAIGAYAMVGGVVAVTSGASIYNAYVKDQMISEAMQAAAEKLNGLPEYDTYREGVLLQAFSQTVDDPELILDTKDLDKDGDTTDKVPRFLDVWDTRSTNYITYVIPVWQSLTANFITTLNDFVTFAKTQYGAGNFLSRQEIDSSDGALVELLRSLRDYKRAYEADPNFEFSFWQPGSADELVEVAGELQDFVNVVEGELLESGLGAYSIPQLTSTWETWIKFFYDPDSTDSCIGKLCDVECTDNYYESFDRLINGTTVGCRFNGLIAWKNEIETARSILPLCNFGEIDEFDVSLCNSCVSSSCRNECIPNPLCKWSLAYSGSINTNLFDEFQNVNQGINLNNGLDPLIQKMINVRAAMKTYYDAMKAATIAVNVTEDYASLTGVNPCTYTWTDSQGLHSIQIQLSNYRLANIARKRYGNFLVNKTCMELRDYQGNCSVGITRSDPNNKAMGVMGNWNPFSGQITKSSNARYTYVGGGRWDLGL